MPMLLVLPVWSPGRNWLKELLRRKKDREKLLVRLPDVRSRVPFAVGGLDNPGEQLWLPRKCGSSLSASTPGAARNDAPRFFVCLRLRGQRRSSRSCWKKSSPSASLAPWLSTSTLTPETSLRRQP